MIGNHGSSKKLVSLIPSSYCIYGHAIQFILISGVLPSLILQLISITPNCWPKIGINYVYILLYLLDWFSINHIII